MPLIKPFLRLYQYAQLGVETLIEEGKSQSDIRQGVTLEVFGEGMSWGPLNEELKAYMKKNQGDIKYDINWTTLGNTFNF